MKKFSIALVCLSILTSCEYYDLRTCIKGDGQPVTQTFQVNGNIAGIQSEIPADIRVYIDPLRAGEMVMTGDHNLINSIIRDIEDQNLTLRSSECWRGNAYVDVDIYVSNLTSVSQLASGRIIVGNTIQSSEFQASVLSSGTIIADINAENLRVSVSGSGNIDLTGSSNEVKAVVTGSGRINGFGNTSTKADAIITGSGLIQLSVAEYLEALIEGSGSVQYKGDPQVKSTIHSSGSVIKVN